MAVAPINCACCGQTFTEPAAQVAGIVVCPGCGGSSVVDVDGTTRRAIAADTTALSDADLQTLRTARGRIARRGQRSA